MSAYVRRELEWLLVTPRPEIILRELRAELCASVALCS